MKSIILLTVICFALPIQVIFSAPAAASGNTLININGPGLVNRPNYPYPNGQSNYITTDVIPGYSSTNAWNVTDDIQPGTTCIENYNCSSKYCNQATGLCQPACKSYQ